MNKLHLALIKINLFWLLIIGFLVVVVVFKKDLIKPRKTDLSPKTIQALDVSGRAILSVIVISVLYSTYLPILNDTFSVMKSKKIEEAVYQRNGEVVRRSRFLFGFWFIRQDIYFKDDEKSFSLYLIGEPVEAGNSYQISYLPNSRAVMEIEKMEGNKN